MRFFILLEGDILARMTDEAYMQRALELALQAEGNTSPNPMVGCVIVDAEGNIVGEGYHHKPANRMPRSMPWRRLSRWLRVQRPM